MLTNKSCHGLAMKVSEFSSVIKNMIQNVGGGKKAALWNALCGKASFKMWPHRHFKNTVSNNQWVNT